MLHPLPLLRRLFAGPRGLLDVVLQLDWAKVRECRVAAPEPRTIAPQPEGRRLHRQREDRQGDVQERGGACDQAAFRDSAFLQSTRQ